MLCAFRWGLFFFFAAMCVIMTITVYGFYPETKGLGIEETPGIFKKHWWGCLACMPQQPRKYQWCPLACCSSVNSTMPVAVAGKQISKLARAFMQPHCARVYLKALIFPTAIY